MPPIDFLLELFRTHGRAAYLGEPVSQAEHALQAATLAEQAGAAAPLVAAALLHDVGHLLDAHAPDPTTARDDHAHEEVGAAWLERHFPEAVTRPVRLHVAAKRYLCAAGPEYLARLSAASAASLRLQGGPFTPVQADAFRADPFADDALRLRRWDEQAKVAGLPTPALAHFLGHLEASLRRQQ
jgi:phosphonate degradation associated HDIG domain protein